MQALGRMGEYERVSAYVWTIYAQGEYGLHEAVMEIKVKKEEVAIRDKSVQAIDV